MARSEKSKLEKMAAKKAKKNRSFWKKNIDDSLLATWGIQPEKEKRSRFEKGMIRKRL